MEKKEEREVEEGWREQGRSLGEAEKDTQEMMFAAVSISSQEFHLLDFLLLKS